MSIHDLPTELLELVFTHLSSEYDFYRVALVCRAWRYPGQLILFSNVCVKSPWEMRLWQKSPCYTNYRWALQAFEARALSLACLTSVVENGTLRSLILTGRILDVTLLTHAGLSKLKHLSILCPESVPEAQREAEIQRGAFPFSLTSLELGLDRGHACRYLVGRLLVQSAPFLCELILQGFGKSRSITAFCKDFFFAREAFPALAKLEITGDATRGGFYSYAPLLRTVVEYIVPLEAAPQSLDFDAPRLRRLVFSEAGASLQLQCLVLDIKIRLTSLLQSPELADQEPSYFRSLEFLEFENLEDPYHFLNDSDSLSRDLSHVCDAHGIKLVANGQNVSEQCFDRCDDILDILDEYS